MGNPEKSIVGDPVQWPGLVYSPLNIPGVIYAFGIISQDSGLIVEEFSETGNTAVCRKKTERGWERVRIGFAVRSSELSKDYDNIDILVCWYDDSSEDSIPVKLELKKFAENNIKNVQSHSSSKIKQDAPGKIREEFMAANEVRENFEETIRQFDDRIKKLRGR